MIIYNYDPITKELIKTGTPVKARLDPLETRKQKRDIFMIPANATLKEPIGAPLGKADVFTGTDWITVDDNRGKVVYDKTTAQPSIIQELGSIPDTVTELEPCAFPKWDGKQWVTDKEAETQAVLSTLIQEKVVESAIAALKAEGKLTVDGKLPIATPKLPVEGKL